MSGKLDELPYDNNTVVISSQEPEQIGEFDAKKLVYTQVDITTLKDTNIQIDAEKLAILFSLIQDYERSIEAALLYTITQSDGLDANYGGPRNSFINHIFPQIDKIIQDLNKDAN